MERLERALDGATVDALYDILVGVPVEKVTKEVMMRSLTAAEMETVSLLDQNGFVSSVEIVQERGLGTSAGSNRLAGLEAKGLVRKAFAWVFPHGGKRIYYASSERAVAEGEIETFTKTLGEGRLSLGVE